MSTPPVDPTSPWVKAIGFRVKVTNPVKGTKITLTTSDVSQSPKSGTVVFAPYDIDGTADNPFQLMGSSNGTDADTSVPFHKLEISPTEITLTFSSNAPGSGDNTEYSLYIFLWAQSTVDTVRIQKTSADKNVGLWGAYIPIGRGQEDLTNLQSNTYVDHNI